MGSSKKFCNLSKLFLLLFRLKNFKIRLKNSLSAYFKTPGIKKATMMVTFKILLMFRLCLMEVLEKVNNFNAAKNG
jgi:hypothetical protein